MSEMVEQQILRNEVLELEADGYQVFVSPSRELRPAFFGDFVPDAIALRSDKKLAVKVVNRSAASNGQYSRISDVMRTEKPWELRLIFIDTARKPVPVDVQNVAAIRSKQDELQTLGAEGHFTIAMLLAWATIEAAARRLDPHKFRVPQTPGRIVQELAGEGYLTPDEADFLRGLAVKRNRFVHGDLAVDVAADEIDKVRSIIGTLLQMADRQPVLATA